jgi:predicted GNAT family N-acyltransferase
MEFRKASIEDIIDLRDRILIRGTHRISADFEGDREAETRHYGAFEDQTCVACVSLMKSEWEGTPAWQLRGMAVEEGWQGQGLGRKLLHFLEADVRASDGPNIMWCNAREPAVAFYERMGWSTASERFIIEDVGPHLKMVRMMRRAPE